MFSVSTSAIVMPSTSLQTNTWHWEGYSCGCSNPQMKWEITDKVWIVYLAPGHQYKLMKTCCSLWVGANCVFNMTFSMYGGTSYIIIMYLIRYTNTANASFGVGRVVPCNGKNPSRFYFYAQDGLPPGWKVMSE